jgi:ABC-2 type transport system permease protein
VTGYRVLLRKELLEQWRTMRLGIVVIVYLAFGILSPVIARYMPELVSGMLPPDQVPLRLPTPTASDAVDQFIKNVGGTLTIAAVLLAMGMIAAEKEHGTAAFILTKPAGRGAYVAAKLSALAAVLGLALAVSGLATYAYTLWLFEPLPAAGVAAMILFVWLSQLSVASITLLASALMRSVVAAGAIGFAAYAVLAMVSALPTVGPYTPAGLQNAAGRLAMGESPSTIAVAVLANVALVAASSVLAVVALRRQEL